MVSKSFPLGRELSIGFGSSIKSNKHSNNLAQKLVTKLTLANIHEVRRFKELTFQSYTAHKWLMKVQNNFQKTLEILK